MVARILTPPFSNANPVRMALSCLTLLLGLGLLVGCGRRSDKDKSDVRTQTVPTDTLNDLRAHDGPESIDSVLLLTRPRTILFTGLPQYRLAPIMKLNFSRDRSSTFYGGIEYRSTWREDEVGLNVWHEHVIPGFDAACGYNIVNVSHFDMQSPGKRSLFDSLVLVKTIYFPTADHDTLNRQPIVRDCYMVSVYDEDTNHDGFVNQNDLRRMYHFALPSLQKTALIPKDHSVLSAEYDPGNDHLFVFTRRDHNHNGIIDKTDDWHIHWISMKNPLEHGEGY